MHYVAVTFELISGHRVLFKRRSKLNAVPSPSTDSDDSASQTTASEDRSYSEDQSDEGPLVVENGRDEDNKLLRGVEKFGTRTGKAFQFRWRTIGLTGMLCLSLSLLCVKRCLCLLWLVLILPLCCVNSTRVYLQCLHRWKYSLQPSISRNKWSSDEDNKLVQAVRKYGHWSLIAQMMGTRTGAQCRERYCNKLDPSIYRGTWTGEEDARLLATVDRIGVGRWAQVRRLSQRHSFLP